MDDILDTNLDEMVGDMVDPDEENEKDKEESQISEEVDELVNEISFKKVDEDEVDLKIRPGWRLPVLDEDIFYHEDKGYVFLYLMENGGEDGYMSDTVERSGPYNITTPHFIVAGYRVNHHIEYAYYPVRGTNLKKSVSNPPTWVDDIVEFWDYVFGEPEWMFVEEKEEPEGLLERFLSQVKQVLG